MAVLDQFRIKVDSNDVYNKNGTSENEFAKIKFYGSKGCK